MNSPIKSALAILTEAVKLMRTNRDNHSDPSYAYNSFDVRVHILEVQIAQIEKLLSAEKKREEEIWKAGYDAAQQTCIRKANNLLENLGHDGCFEFDEEAAEKAFLKQ